MPCNSGRFRIGLLINQTAHVEAFLLVVCKSADRLNSLLYLCPWLKIFVLQRKFTTKGRNFGFCPFFYAVFFVGQ